MENSSIIKSDNISLPTSKQGGDNLPNQDITFRQINDFLTFEKEVFVRDGSNSKNYPIFYLATAPCFLIEARLRHEVNGGAGATVDIEKLASGVLKGNGVSMLSSKFDISTGQGFVQMRSGSITLVGYQLLPGDAIALKATGTLTNASNIAVGVLFGIQAKNLPKGPSASVRLVGI